jgi:alcohol dehydrogenase
LSAISVARHLGARTAAVDRQEPPLALARRQGAELTTLSEAAERAVVEWSGGGVDAAFEMSGSPQAFGLATRLVRPGGRVVTVGYAPGTDYGVESARLVRGELTIVGSRAGTPRDAREALAAVEAGTIAPPPIARVGPLEALNDGYADLSRGDVVGRLVFTP